MVRFLCQREDKFHVKSYTHILWSIGLKHIKHSQLKFTITSKRYFNIEYNWEDQDVSLMMQMLKSHMPYLVGGTVQGLGLSVPEPSTTGVDVFTSSFASHQGTKGELDSHLDFLHLQFCLSASLLLILYVCSLWGQGECLNCHSFHWPPIIPASDSNTFLQVLLRSLCHSCRAFQLFIRFEVKCMCASCALYHMLGGAQLVISTFISFCDMPAVILGSCINVGSGLQCIIHDACIGLCFDSINKTLTV